jgi:hypothetical protein
MVDEWPEPDDCAFAAPKPFGKGIVEEMEEISRTTDALKKAQELAAAEMKRRGEPNCPDCGLPHPSRNPYCFCRRL